MQDSVDQLHRCTAESFGAQARVCGLDLDSPQAAESHMTEHWNEMEFAGLAIPPEGLMSERWLLRLQPLLEEQRHRQPLGWQRQTVIRGLECGGEFLGDFSTRPGEE